MLEISDKLTFKPNLTMSAKSFEKFKIVFSFTRKDGLMEKEIMRILAKFKKLLKKNSRIPDMDAFAILLKILDSLAKEYMLETFIQTIGENKVIVLSDYAVNPMEDLSNAQATLERAELQEAEIAFMYKKQDNTGTYHTALVERVNKGYFLGYHYHKAGSRHRNYRIENMSFVNVYPSRNGFTSFEGSFVAKDGKVLYSLREESAVYNSEH